MVELYTFEKTDIARLIGWIPDARFLLQWAGPQYRYPLDEAQLIASLEQTDGAEPSYAMFKAVLQPGGEVIGHAELMRIDRVLESGHLGRVLVGLPELRGQGYGKQIVQAAVDLAFGKMGLQRMTLNVFDFNHVAISCYREVGFVEYEHKEDARQFGDESWGLVRMRLDRSAWYGIEAPDW